MIVMILDQIPAEGRTGSVGFSHNALNCYDKWDSNPERIGILLTVHILIQK